ncbi:MAG: helix-turn-helix transcriptional regulator [Chloroflexi bacterium]|nr:helix-turn-helix transcriptional regulator [Chloroflexota bacterium]
MDQSPGTETFGEVIRTTRKAKGLTQRQLAERLKIDFTYLSKVENDRGDPPGDDLIRRLAGELGLDPEMLLVAAGKVPPELRELAQSDRETAVFLRKLPRMSESERRKVYRNAPGKPDRP